MDEYVLYFLKKDTDKKLTRLTDLYSAFNLFAAFFLFLYSFNAPSADWIVRLVFFCLSVLCVSVEFVAISLRSRYVKNALSDRLKVYETEGSLDAYQNYYNTLLPAIKKEGRRKGMTCLVSYVFFAILFGIDLIQQFVGLPPALGITLRSLCDLLVLGAVAGVIIEIIMDNKRRNLLGKELQEDLKSIAPNKTFSAATLRTPDPERYFFSDAVAEKAHFRRKKTVALCAVAFGAISMIFIIIGGQSEISAFAVSGGIILAMGLLCAFFADLFHLNQMKQQASQNPQNEVEQLRKTLFDKFHQKKRKFVLVTLIGYLVLLALVVVHNVFNLFLENDLFLILAIFYGIAYTLVYFVSWIIVYRGIRKQAVDSERRIDELTGYKS